MEDQIKDINLKLFVLNSNLKKLLDECAYLDYVSDNKEMLHSSIVNFSYDLNNFKMLCLRLCDDIDNNLTEIVPEGETNGTSFRLPGS